MTNGGPEKQIRVADSKMLERSISEMGMQAQLLLGLAAQAVIGRYTATTFGREMSLVEVQALQNVAVDRLTAFKQAVDRLTEPVGVEHKPTERLTDQQLIELIEGVDFMMQKRGSELEVADEKTDVEGLSADFHEMSIFKHGLLVALGRVNPALPLSTGECTFGFGRGPITISGPRSRMEQPVRDFREGPAGLAMG